MRIRSIFFFSSFFVIGFLIVNALSGPSQARSPEISDIFAFARQGQNIGTYAELVDMAEFAVERHTNVFQLLRDTALYFDSKDSSIIFSGADLQTLNQHYSLGNDVANALLPVAHVATAEVGRKNGRAVILVKLDGDAVTTRFSYRLVPVELHLSQTYGALEVTPDALRGVTGVQAEHVFGVADVTSVRLTGSGCQVQLAKGPSPSVSIPAIQRRH